MARLGPIPGAPDNPTTLVLGFVYSHPEVDTAIVGTGNPSHLRSNVEVLERGVALHAETLEELYSRFDKLDDGWRGQLLDFSPSSTVALPGTVSLREGTLLRAFHPARGDRR